VPIFWLHFIIGHHGHHFGVFRKILRKKLYKKKIPEIVKMVSMVSNFLRINFIPTFPGNPGNLDPVSVKISLGFAPAQKPFDSQ